MPQSLTCTPTGVFPGYQRFRGTKAPKAKPWRCDLTALSQVYNLFFIAYDEEIHVYQLGFPDQAPEEEPDLILHPPVSSEDLSFVIDPISPHSITRIHVDYLGHDEVLLATCDDGDVVGYRVNEILKATECHIPSNLDCGISVQGSSVRTFLHRNVGKSAWGLAIHRDARMIAISANTHEVTVLAYALAESEDEFMSSDFEENENQHLDTQAPDFPNPRKRDHVITLIAGANIPSVSFDNSGEDPTGRWLFCSSIDGSNMLWDLHNPHEAARTFRLGYCCSAMSPTKAPQVAIGECSCLRPDNVPHGAWHSSFLDVRAAVDVLSGHGAEYDETGYFQDLTSQKSHFTLAQSGQMPSSWIPSSLIDNSGIDMGLTEITDNDEGNNQLQAEGMHDSMQEGINPENDEEDTMLIDDGTDHVEIIDSPLVSDQEESDETASTTAPQYIYEINSPWPEGTETMASIAQITFSMPGTGPVGQSGSTAILPKFYAQFDSSQNLQCSTIESNSRSPCIVVTKEEIYLVPNPIGGTAEYNQTILAMRQPLHPNRLWQSNLGSANRQCFFKQIPELGIFIVASPVGRAGIFSITKSARQSLTSDKKVDFTYGFRLEFILPFRKGEPNKAWNPLVGKLIGVAVGPVQGMFDEPGQPEDGFSGRRQRRWRVILSYTDNTIASFELSRRARDGTPEVDELMV